MHSSATALLVLSLVAPLASPSAAQDPEGGGEAEPPESVEDAAQEQAVEQAPDAVEPEQELPTEPEPLAELELPRSWDSSRLDAPPPSAVRHALLAEAGSWLFGYRYERQDFEGLRDGREDESRSDLVADDYSVFSEEMTWQTHTFQVLYGLDEMCSLYLELPVIEKELEGEVAGGGSFDSDSNGLGDLEVGLVRTLREQDGEVLRGNLGVSLPTGSYDEEDDGAVLPYAMQLGSGTFDLYPGLTWMNQGEEWTWGLQGQARLRFGKNDDDWAASNSFTFQSWAARPLSRSVVGTLRLQWKAWGDYHGENEELDALKDADPLRDSHRQGGARTDLAAGLQWELGADARRLNRIEAEVAVPVSEWLDGPQMSAELVLTLGWRFSI